ncbi:2-heptyl-3-hydroxy-4(1H)-quinolone synthase [Colletotrichum sp. SAR 10_96]|nr:2-heptyl-3-hydroxy-4(1H)-quinolone synthase [Colletotrichum sp. SAR 10_96]
MSLQPPSVNSSVPPSIDGKFLFVNDDLLAPAEVGILKPSFPDEPVEVLRDRYHTRGYLLVKGLLPRQDVLAARESYFASLSPSGILKPGTAPKEGIFDPEANPSNYPGIGAGAKRTTATAPGSQDKRGMFMDAALKAHTDEWYCGSTDGRVRGFCNHPALKAFVAHFTGWGDNTLPVKRTLLRNNTPGNKAIGVHYDQSFMRYGEPIAVTAWVPIGDVSLEGGGLIYLEDGEALGAEIEQDFERKAMAAGMTDEEVRHAYNVNMMSTGWLCNGAADFGRKYGKKWLVTEYEAGDVVFHTPHMIHASTINFDPKAKYSGFLKTGKLLEQSSHAADIPLQQRSCRLVRAKLQAALLQEVDKSRIRVSKKLTNIEKLQNGKIRIDFADGFTDEVDLLVGADGIRSFVRSFAFPDHKIKYNGQSAYRTIISKSAALNIEGIPRSPVFWQNVGGKYVFTCPLGGDDFEVTARIRRPTEGQEHVSWGRPFDFSTIASEYDEFCEPVRKVIQLAAQGNTEEFALFSGARLESVISHDAIALIGDASHPLSGAFGAGAGFALEDVWALTRSLDFARTNGEGLAVALKLYDQIRSPHYRDLYGVLDNFAAVNSKLLAEQLPADDEIEERVRRASEKKATWMYHYEVDKAVENFFGGQGQSVQPAALL